MRAGLVTRCSDTGRIRPRPRPVESLKEADRAVEGALIVRALAGMMTVEVVGVLVVSRLEAEGAARLVLRMEAVVGARVVRCLGQEALALATLGAVVRVLTAYEMKAVVWAVSCQSVAAASASCLYSMRPKKASSP